MFNKHITDFNENIIGLRDFVDLIEPYLTEKFEEHNKNISPLIALGILNDIYSKKDDWQEGEMEKYDKFKEDLNITIKDIYKKEVQVEIEKNVDSNGVETEPISFKFKSSDTPELRNHLDNAKKVKEHIELLYKNSLISILSSVEWFFSQILHFHYDKFPESAGIEKKTITLSDLKNFGSIEDAEKFLIDTKIEEILRGNFDSWLILLKSDLKLSLGYIEPIKDELIEIYQRRNLFVHNGGIVNSIYLSKVNEKFKSQLKINDQLIIDKEYLDNAICKLQKAFILIASELWKNTNKDDKSRGAVLTEIVYENLLKSRWDICEGLTYFIINDSQLEVTDKVVGQLNHWLCKKETGKIDIVKKEIEKADYSDKKEIFQLALHALKEDLNSFFETLPLVLESKQLTIDELEEFPIFREIRETQEYKNFKDKSKFFNSENESKYEEYEEL